MCEFTCQNGDIMGMEEILQKFLTIGKYETL